MINLKTLDIKIIDIDNITSETEAVNSTMLGAYPFIAPEKALKPTNNADTDLYSLSVFYFYMFLGTHPFAGKKLKVDALDPFLNLIYKFKEKFYIFHENSINLPNDIITEQWNSLPTILKLAFNKSFDNALFHPEKRISNRDWINIFSEMYSSM